MSSTRSQYGTRFNTAPPEFDTRVDLPPGFLKFLEPLHRELTLRQQSLARKRAAVLAASHEGRKPNYVLAARLDALTKKGLSPFAVHQLPQAVITLKQGAGRLIRAETDRGVLMICDTRLVDKPYGRRIWQSLPPFKRTRELDVVRAFFSDSPNSAVELAD